MILALRFEGWVFFFFQISMLTMPFQPRFWKLLWHKPRFFFLCQCNLQHSIAVLASFHGHSSTTARLRGISVVTPCPVGGTDLQSFLDSMYILWTMKTLFSVENFLLSRIFKKYWITLVWPSLGYFGSPVRHIFECVCSGQAVSVCTVGNYVLLSSLTIEKWLYPYYSL